MRIGYLARHTPQGNDDEGAIAYALDLLGHDVVKLGEGDWEGANQTDFALFHKGMRPDTLKRINVPKFGWYFDKVKFKNREPLFKALAQNSDLMFLTDGDYAKESDLDNLVVLRQGIDTRYARHIPYMESKRPPIAFIGSIYGPRVSFCVDVRKYYGDKFVIYNGIYLRKLAYCYSTTPIIIAPPYPSTDDYWSNRVYLTTGYGGLLIHPYCKGLEEEFEDKKHIVMYKDYDEMYSWIDMLLKNHKRREKIRLAGYQQTRYNYSYKKRCKTLLNIVQKSIGKKEPKRG